MDDNYLTNTDIVRIVDELWGAMLNLELTPVEMPVSGNAKRMVACVQIVGEWEGCVRLDISPSLARQAAAAFLGVVPSQVSSDQVRDCAGELANITAGSVKLLFPTPSKISLPTVTDGGDYFFTVRNGRKLMESAFDREGEKFLVTIIERDDREAYDA